MIKTIIILASVLFELLGCFSIGYGHFGIENDKNDSYLCTLVGIAFIFMGLGATVASVFIA